MSNNSNNRTNRSLLDSERNRTSNDYNQLTGIARTGLANAIPQSNALRGQIAQQYTDMGNMPNGLKPNSSGWFDLPSTGGGGDFSGSKSGYQNFADTGGAGDFADAKGAWNNVGIGDTQAIRDRAGSVIPSFYEGYKNTLKRKANTQGGYSPGFDAQMAEVGRQAGREGFNASRGVEADIADRTLAATSAKAGGLTNIASSIQQGKLAGLGGLESVAGREASLGDAAAGRGLQAQLALLGMQQRGRETSAAGLSDIYRSAPGDVGQMAGIYGSSVAGRSGNALNNLNLRSNIQDQSMWDYLPGLMGGAGGFMAGLG